MHPYIASICSEKLSNWRCLAEPFNNLQQLSLGIASDKLNGFQEEDVLALKFNPNI